MKKVWLLSLVFMLFACQQPVEEVPADGDQGDRSAASQNCELSKLGLDASLGAPSTIEQAIDLINALPKPVSIPCFVQALQRPLRVNATSSILSAQPAAGEENPRLFLFSGTDLIISIVPAGGGEDLMEFSQLINDAQSIKGELKFPVFDNIPYSAPYESILSADKSKTVCSACHAGEVLDTNHQEENVFISAAVKPKDSKVVYLSDFWQENYACEVNNDRSKRCLMINAVFNHGQVQHQDFPSAMPFWLQSLGF